MTMSKPLPDDAMVRSIKQRLDRPLVLVGMMGVGKSTVGRRLANVLNMDFTDADEEIVQAANMSVADIFDQFGEEYFRDGERRVIARLMDQSGAGCVLATGGGAFLEDETRALIKQEGVAIWLDAAIDTLVERVSRNKRRPLLRTGDINAKVTKMKTEREPIYAEAHIHVKSDSGPHQTTVNRILEGLDQWLS
ncbi:shikimate kinase [Aurantiacibacter sediminis]|uniref:Shikimate kinase n=1 Tax=Aurantiacibacter sediminis TaxID=2793064 RepID=A0ABS0N4C2_9SPHN|nr:shikimate kinase [Aurantiacibacter sediminis]MBH5322828.1 shikimate kinase [Aurantiacibacter sediminis]